jgi:hypothetical protein
MVSQRGGCPVGPTGYLYCAEDCGYMFYLGAQEEAQCEEYCAQTCNYC